MREQNSKWLSPKTGKDLHGTRGGEEKHGQLFLLVLFDPYSLGTSIVLGHDHILLTTSKFCYLYSIHPTLNKQIQEQKLTNKTDAVRKELRQILTPMV